MDISLAGSEGSLKGRKRARNREDLREIVDRGEDGVYMELK